MKNQVGIKFTYYRMGISISRMTDFEDMQEVVNIGLERVAHDCLREVKDATELDLNKLSHPYPATRFCFFSEINSENESIIEGSRKKVVNEEKEEAAH
jgi:hypothetical protein